MIEVKNLTKVYGNHKAVDNLSFSIENGKIYGLLGPNGAGKSTTMNMITGCLAATSGTVLIDGHDIFEDPIEAKKHVGYLPELPPVYADMTPAEYLLFVAEAKGVPENKRFAAVREAMNTTGITSMASRLIANLSKGYRQRVGIAQALIGNPDTVILDEPTVGLDPKQIIEIRDLIKKLGKTKTVIISSHILAEISAVCDHVIIISHGHIVTDSSLAELESSAESENGLSVSVRGDRARVQAIAENVPGLMIRGIGYSDGVTTFTAVRSEERPDDMRETLFFAFAKENLPIIGMFTRESTLESIFLDLIEKSEAEYTAGTHASGRLYSRIEKASDAPVQSDEDRDFGKLKSPKQKAAKNKKAAKEDEDDYTPMFSSGSDEEDDK